MAKHCMYLSELYGRIGQMLRENGDAPIGRFRMPLFPNETHLSIDWIKPLYCDFTCVTTEIGEVKIKNYEIIIDE